MADELPHIPDFKPTGKEVAPVVDTKHTSIKTKFALAGVLAIMVAVAVSAVAVGNPLTIIKRASTAPELKNADYNRSVYGLECPAPNFWAVPEGDGAKCAPEDSTIKCGEICPETQRTGIANSEGHQCCRPQTPPEKKVCFDSCRSDSDCGDGMSCAATVVGNSQCVLNVSKGICPSGSGKDCWCNPPPSVTPQVPVPSEALKCVLPKKPTVRLILNCQNCK